jgi:drug/metabolite transporter (DMT)-like permease
MGKRIVHDAGPGAARRALDRRRAGGIAYVLVSGACFGSMPLFARRAYADGIDPATLLALRFTLAAACLWAVLAWKGHTLPRGRGLAVLVAMGAVGYAGQAFCYFTAITLASVGLVSLLLYLYPALVALLARVVFCSPLSWPQVAAVAIALAGSALTIGRAGDGKPLGIALGLLAALVYSVYILAGSRLPAGISPLAASAVITTAAAATCGAAAAARGLRLPAHPAGWAAVLGVAVLGTVLAILFFFEGMERVGPVRASVYSTVEPMVTLGLAAALLGEPVTLVRALGGVLIVGAVLLLAREELRAGPPEPVFAQEEACIS